MRSVTAGPVGVLKLGGVLVLKPDLGHHIAELIGGRAFGSVVMDACCPMRQAVQGALAVGGHFGVAEHSQAAFAVEQVGDQVSGGVFQAEGDAGVHSNSFRFLGGA